MTVAISFNGSSYNIPVTGDSSGWGDDLSNYLIDLAGNALTLGTSKIKVRVPTSSPVTVLSTDAAILSNLSSAGPVTFNLPTGITNQYYIIGDAKGDAATNNITINTSSSQTIDGASSYTINWNWGAVGLLFNGTQWSILNFYRPQFLASFPSRTSSTASTTATVNDNLVWLTYAGARTFTLPSSAPNGLVIAVGDGNTAFTNNIVVSPPSGQTIGLAATYTISSNGSITGFQYNSFDSDWKVITQGSTPQFATVRNVSGSNLQLQTDAASGKSVVIAPNASAQITVQPANAANADVVFNGTAGITLPTGAGTAQPSSPVVGTLRYNSTSLKIEQYVNGAWRSLVDETNTQTLTNKTISTASNTVVLSDTTTNIVNVSDNTKKINLSPAANTTGATLTVASNQATSQTINVPAITTTDTLATIGLGQTFTGANTFSGNNSFSGTTNTFTNSPVLNAGITIQQITTPANPSSNYNKIYTKSDNNAYILTSGGIETQIGSGTSSSVNYIGGNYNFENGTVTGWATYSNTAQSTPVNGTGGSPASTFVASSSSPLRGTYSGLFTKSAANRQGEGFSFNFAINGVDTGKTLQISFDWLASTNYAPADMGIYVYDVTNSTLITPSVANLPSGTSSQYSVAFNATTSTSYRLIFHVASTSALAYTTQIDNISISPVIRPVVSGISDWIAYTPTITGNVGTSIIGEYKRVGDLLFGKFSYTQSSTSAVLWSISLPSGLTIDTTKMALNTTTSVTSEIIGSVIFGTGAGDTGYLLASTSTSTSVIYAGGDNLSSTNTGIPQTGSVLGGTSTSVVGYFQVPIAQWSSGITLSSTSTPLQFVSNSSTTDANDTSAFTYGAGGSPLPGTLTATRTKRVQLQNSYQSIDDIELFIIPAINYLINLKTRLKGQLPMDSL